MRLYDVARPYFTLANRVVDATSLDLDVRVHLRPPDDVSAEISGRPAAAGDGDLLLLRTSAHGDGLAEDLSAAGVGTVVLVLLDWEGEQPAFQVVLDILVRHGVQVLQFASLDDVARAAVVGRRTDGLLMPGDVLGAGPPGAVPATPGAALRLAGEYVFADVLVRHLRAGLDRSESAGAALEHRKAQELASLAAELEDCHRLSRRAQAEARSTGAELQRTHAQLATAQERARLGNMLVAAAEHPGRRTLGLMRRMLTWWWASRRTSRGG